MSELIDAATVTAQYERERWPYSFGRSNEWYVVLPNRLVHYGGRTVEQFAAEFEESAKRMVGLPFGNMVGFEVEMPGGMYRYRLACYREDPPETTEEETPA